MKQTLTVRAVIKQDQKILLLRRVGGNPLYVGLYELPGGKVDFGQDPRAALQRQVFDQTGRELETLQLYDVYSELDVHDLQHQFITLVFLATFKPETAIKIDASHDKFIWKRLADIQLEELTETTRMSLQIESLQGTHQSKIENNDVSGATVSEVIIYADGGSRGNPGASASGFVIKDASERVISRGGEYLGLTTNNQAEYQAVKLGLTKARAMGVRSVKLRLDSLLVVNQLKGLYKVKNRDLLPIYESVQNLIREFEAFTVTHVRREFNTEADAMVNKILDERTPKL